MNASVSARRLFVPAALFNFASAGTFLFALPQAAGPMRIEVTPALLPFVHISAGAVAIFGWGYWQVARDPVQNRIVIVLGLAGKLAVAALGIAHAFAGNIGWAFAALTVVDLVFAALFWRFLRAYPAARPPEPAASVAPPA